MVSAALSAAEVPASARRVHESLLTLDTHLDTPAWLSVSGWSILDAHDVKRDGSQIDVPRMKQGGLDGGFWAVYIPQGPLTAEGRANARDAALVRLQEIRELAAAHPRDFTLAFTAADAPRIAATGKRIVYLSMENGYPFGEDVTLLRTFYRLGVRIAGVAHFLNNDLGDSSTDPAGAKWRGLSPLGKQWVAEANRLGVLIDASHSSDDVFDQLLELSRAPIVLTHSGARAVFDHPRNVDDARLRRLAAKGGVIQISAYSDYMIPRSADAARTAERSKLLRARGNTLPEREAAQKALGELEQRSPAPRADFEAFIAHLRHAIEVAGIDHVGIGIDFDGGGGVTGLDDARDYPKISAALLAAGYSREDLEKVWSGNVLRVLAAAQSAAETAR
ncbi:MAG: dipeptidase [Steroidobacteraceae bacterium]